MPSSKFDKFKSAFKIGSTVAKPFAPGGIGTLLDLVNAGLEDKDDPENQAAIMAVATAVAQLDERLQELEGK